MMKSNPSNRTVSAHQQTGVSLIEVLVSVLVLGIGLLGAAALQSSGLRHANTSQMEIRAQLLAQDLAEMIMAFDTNASGVYDIDIPASVDTDCQDDLCDATAMAEYNLWLWDQNMHPKLPSYDLDIDFDTTTDAATGATTNTYTIIMTWDAEMKGDDYDASTCTATDSLNPGCLALQFNIRG